jgi:hypothetical protein
MWCFLNPSKGNNSKWLYHIVIVEPRATAFHDENMRITETTAKLQFFTSLARKFYLSAFEANAENTFKIDRSIVGQRSQIRQGNQHLHGLDGLL